MGLQTIRPFSVIRDIAATDAPARRGHAADSPVEIRGPASSEYWTIPSGLDVAEAREADPPRLTEATTSPLGTVAAAGLDAREAALTAARVRDALSSERLPIGNTAPQNLRTLFRV